MPTTPIPNSQALAEESDAIYALIQQVQEAWNGAANNDLAALFREDVDYTAWNGIHFHGREAVLRNHRRIFGSRYLGGRLFADVHNIRFLSEVVAAVHVAVRLETAECAEIEEACGMRQVAEGMALFLVTKRGNHWRCEVFHNTLVTHP